MDLSCRDTICIQATGSIQSAISVIRISGPLSINIKRLIFKTRRKKNIFYKAIFGNIVNEGGFLIDHGMCTAFSKRKGYTGEDSFELSVHGNQLIIRKIINTLIYYGCRLAKPGEFSMRSFLNGKANLCTIESVHDLISAKSHIAINLALKNLKGGVEKKLNNINDILIDCIAYLEAMLDFVDHPIKLDKMNILNNLNYLKKKILNILKLSSLSKNFVNGINIVICGNPNTGK